jgi:hypothetical protein
VPPFVVMKFSVNIADVKLQQYAIAAGPQRRLTVCS